jgi:hypothetical protein
MSALQNKIAGARCLRAVVFPLAFWNMKQALSFAGTALLAVAFGIPANAAVLELGARRLFDDSVTQHLRMDRTKSAIEVEAGELFEDDGPAAGHSYQQPKNQEQLGGDTWIKKELVIPNPQARHAFLVILSDDHFETMINGVPQQFGPNQSGRQSYQTLAFDPAVLKPGRNDIVLHGSGKVLIARDDEFAQGSRTRTRHPNRSAKSTDGGKTWDYDHLAPNGQLDGEYGVRIFLDHYRAEGSLVFPVLDAGNLEEKPVGSPVTLVGPIKVVVDAAGGPEARVRLRVRSGASYLASDKSWSDWQWLPDTGGTIEHPAGRYIQLAVELSSRDPLQTPKLKSIHVSANPIMPEDWTAHLRVLENHNPPILRTSIPFEFESLDHLHLKQLRQEYKLDEVVQGARTELELMLRLAQWACNYWDWPNHITEQYPPWDALEILKPHKDGTPVGGFCQQFNLVFLQACESFGFNGRAISISQGCLQEKCPGGGHEIVELWSNEWQKWVYVDGALAWYIVDQQSGTPLSMLELRERQLALMQGESAPAVRPVAAARTRNKQFQWSGLWPKPLNWYAELRMIPRSNFLEKQSPLPLNQGTEEWAWTGHYVWTDDQVSAGRLFGNRVSKRSDFEWTLNQAHYLLEPSPEPGTVRVHVDTETPSFDTFLAEIDGADKHPVVSGFAWKLHPGTNQLRIRPRNVLGREGIPSWIALEYR